MANQPPTLIDEVAMISGCHVGPSRACRRLIVYLVLVSIGGLRSRWDQVGVRLVVYTEYPLGKYFLVGNDKELDPRKIPPNAFVKSSCD